MKSIAYSAWNVIGGYHKFEKKDLYLKNEMVLEELEELLRYWTDWGKDGKSMYVDGTVMPLVRLDAWTGCEWTTMDAEIGRVRGRQTLLTVLFRRYLRCAAADILKMA